MVDLSWLAYVVFFGSYFIAWLEKEIAHTTWLNVSAIAALVAVIMLLLFNGYPYLTHRTPPQA